MNVMRFNAKDNRSALAQVREALGPEALILSNRRTAEGVEICATVDLPDLTQAKILTPRLAPSSVGGSDLTLAQLKREMAILRETLQKALGERKWQDSAGVRPVLATVEQRLATLGIGRELIGALTAGLRGDLALPAAWAQTLQNLMARIDCLTPTEIDGLRVKAVIGAPGSGKTTAVGALIRSALLRLEPRDLAVISFSASALTDPLVPLCEEFGIRYHSVSDHKTLARAMGQCAFAREVLIDTRGLSLGHGSQDPMVSALTGQRAGWAALLMVPATAQRDYLLRLGEHVAGLPVAGALVSKLDDAVSFGPSLDLLLGYQLPLAGCVEITKQTIVSLSPQEVIQRTKALARTSLQRQAKQLKVAV